MTPLVSCLMPTFNRRRHVPQAIRYFLEQDYPNKELIILDDGSDSVADLVPTDPRIRYERLPTRVTLGKKRNLACERAQGEILVHWDDDDWFSRDRLTYQCGELVRTGADLCGISRMWFFNAQRSEAWEYVYQVPRKPWVAGGSLCYRRSFWQSNRFPDLPLGEDTRFVWARPSAKLHAHARNDFYAALIHPSNTSSKRVQDARYQPRAFSHLATLLGPDLAFYVSATPSTPTSPSSPTPPTPPVPSTPPLAILPPSSITAAEAPSSITAAEAPVFSLCYTSRRPSAIPSIVRQWRERASKPEACEVLICIDSVDTASLAAAKTVPDARVLIQDAPPFNCVKGWNCAAAAATGTVLIGVSDDIEPPLNWDASLLALAPSWTEVPAVILTHDGLHGTECHLAIVTRARYTQVGYLFHPGYESMYCDTDLAAHARHDGVALDARSRLRFQHHHVDNRHRAKDAIDVLHSSKERYQRGAALFHQRQARGFKDNAIPVQQTPALPTAMETHVRYAAYLQAIHDDFCLSEVLQRLFDEGVRDFFLSIPDEHWNGKATSEAEKAEVYKAAEDLRARTSAAVQVAVHAVGKHRRPGVSRSRVETFVRNEALAWVASQGFRHCLVVDDDELWRRGLLSRLTTLVTTRQPATVACQMTPVVGVPGYPVGENKDMVTIYMDLKVCRFRECRSPDKPSTHLLWNGVLHFTAVKKTREELIEKMRGSGHYDDPHYDFEGWIANKLPHLKPGFRNVHMYVPTQIWPVIREWSPEEIADLPESLLPFVGGIPVAVEGAGSAH